MFHLLWVFLLQSENFGGYRSEFVVDLLPTQYFFRKKIFLKETADIETNQKLKLQKKIYISILLTKMKIILFLTILVKELKCMTIWWKYICVCMCVFMYVCIYIYTYIFFII